MTPDQSGQIPPTLKRPRSDPPSPSTSSPKRAASEDPFASSSESGRQPADNTGITTNAGPSSSILLNTLAQPGQLGSSPLRMDVDDEQESTGSWVTRTGQVSLSEAETERGAETPINQCSSRELYDIVLSSLPPPFDVYQTFHLLPKSFLSALSQHALYDASSSSPPPLLDLSSLVEPENLGTVHAMTKMVAGKPVHHQQKMWKLRPGLAEDEDFVFLSAEGWDKLAAWYDYPSEEPTLPRICLPDGRIEIAPNVYTLHVIVPVPPAHPLPPLRISAPSTTSLVDFRAFIRSVLAQMIPVGTPVRLWSIVSPPSEGIPSLVIQASDMPTWDGKMIKANNVSLADAGFFDGDSIAVEIGVSRNGAGAPDWMVNELAGEAVEKVVAPPPLFVKPAFFSGTGKAESSSSQTALTLKVGPNTRSQSRGRHGKGLVGLTNLGNTCFLASATQCLSNTQVLAEYFLSGVYREELNPDNPLGMHGQVAEAFGETIENLWGSSGHAYSPRRLKSTCSRFAPQFAGYGQHDTQEFLAFLLDGLHEDLNRIKKKPYIEKPDWKPGGGDRELAELGRECWEGYKKRNDSVIVDLFQGQLQSTLVCPECHKESITMDPFMYLTVPLPIAQTRVFKLTFFPRDTERLPVNVELLVPINASFSAVKDKLGAIVKCPGSNIVGFDYWKHNIYAWFLDSDANSEAKSSDVCVFHELPVPSTATHKGVGTLPTDGSITVPVYTYVPHDAGASRSSFQRDMTPNENALEPFFITLSRAEATNPNAVREAIMRGYSRLVKPEKKAALFVPDNAPQAKVSVNDDLEEGDEGHVTEIHIDGESTRVVEVPETAEEDRDDAEIDQESIKVAPPHIAEADSVIPRNISSISVTSQISNIVGRGDLFKVYVADASSSESLSGSMTASVMSAFNSRKDFFQSLYRGNPVSASTNWSLLERRSKTKKHMIQRISSSISSLVGSAANSEDEGDGGSLHRQALPAPSLCVRPGEGIFVKWNGPRFAEFFVRERSGLQAELETIVDPAIEREIAKKKQGRSISIEDCLDEFSKEETLGQDDLWYCPQCKKHQAATKKLDIYKAPDILVICIKRFGSSRQMRDKLDHLVNFPIDGLDLEERIGERKIAKSLNLSGEEAKKYGIEESVEPMVYDLYAVDNHFGGMGGGHYTAFCRNKEDGQWYNYDDTRVSKSSVDAVQSRAAYLLFYKRRTTRPIGGISRIKAEEASRAASPAPPESPHRTPSPPPLSPPSFADGLPKYRSSPPPSFRSITLPDSSAPLTPRTASPANSSSSLDSDFFVEDKMTSVVRNTETDQPANFAVTGPSIGFGNTAWTTSRESRPSDEVVHHTFGANLHDRPAEINTPPTPPDSTDPASPDSSDEEFLPIETDMNFDSWPTVKRQNIHDKGETGLGEDYHVVKDSVGSDTTSYAEMMSSTLPQD